MVTESLSEAVDLYTEQEGITTTEGTRGVKNLCKLVHALGYVDKMYFGQFEGASYGDLINFLEDNPGAIQSIVEWIRNSSVDEWKECLESETEYDEDS